MRFLISLALAFLQATAYPAAAVFSSSTEVKTLKDNLSINGKCKFLTGTADPTSSAQNAPACSVYMNTSTGKLYRKTDAGSSTNWNRIPSPSGAGTSGQVVTADGAGSESWATSSSAPDQSYEVSNLAISASVAGNALTIALKTKAGTDASGSDVIGVGMRSSTATSGIYERRTVTGALSLVVSSGSTLGHVSAVAEYAYVYLIDNAGTLELAVTSTPLIYEAGQLISTTAEGGAGAADSRTAIYSTTARSGVACRYVGRLKSTQATAGTWATAIAEVALLPAGDLSSNYKKSSTCGTGQSFTSTSYADLTNLTLSFTTNGRPVEIFLVPDGTANFAFLGAQYGTSSTTFETCYYKLVRDSTDVGITDMGLQTDNGTVATHNVHVPPSAIRFFDTDAAAGTYTYKLQGKTSTTNGFCYYDSVKLVAVQR